MADVAAHRPSAIYFTRNPDGSVSASHLPSLTLITRELLEEGRPPILRSFRTVTLRLRDGNAVYRLHRKATFWRRAYLARRVA